MSRSEMPLEEVEGFKDLWSAQRKNLSCVALRLKAGGYCLYSPVEKLSAACSGKDPVRYLLAPNHYHNKGIAEFSDAFPGAALVCPDAARPRLEKVTGHRFEGLDALEEELPANVRIVAPDGLKTGEAWLQIRDGDRLAWVVTDAFCGVTGPDGTDTRIGILKTFPKYGVKDAGTFVSWVRHRLEIDPPDLVLPCHGDAVRGASLKQDMLALLDDLSSG